MWKDFFYYSKSERRVIGLLLILASILVAANIYSLWKEEEIQEKTSLANTIQPDTPEADTAGPQGRTMPTADKKAEGKGTEKHPELHLPTRNFDPNTATREELTEQGLSKYVVDNILKYRAKGGKFRTTESLRKIYGLDEDTYESVRPRITIAKEFQPKKRKPQPQYERIKKFAPGTIININTADTATLKQIPGIGSVLSRRIVAYRNRLGGFHSISQLQEIPGIEESLNKWFETGNMPLQKLAVNQCTLEELRKHPYMNYYRAKTIMDYRKRYGKIMNMEPFGMFETFSNADIEKLTPYLSFD